MDVTFPEGFAVVTAGREEAVFVKVSIPGIDELVFAFTQSTTSLNSAWSHHPPPHAPQAALSQFYNIIVACLR
jgi:hypothetical protein